MINTSWMITQLANLSLPDGVYSHFANLAPTLDYTTDQIFQSIFRQNLNDYSLLVQLSPRFFCLTMPLGDSNGGSNKFFCRAIRIDIVAQKIIYVAFLINRQDTTNFRELEMLEYIKGEWDKYIQTYSLLKLEESKSFIIVQELFDCDLYELIYDGFVHITPFERLQIACQIIHQVEYLHTHSIVHRDLKTENVLIQKNGLKAVITDFGSACLNRNIDSIAGTREYWPPEVFCVLTREEEFEIDWCKCDMWSLGYLFAVLFEPANPPPWDSQTEPMKPLFAKIKEEYKKNRRIKRETLDTLLVEMKKGFLSKKKTPLSDMIAELLSFEAGLRPCIAVVAERFKRLLSAKPSINLLLPKNLDSMPLR